MSPAFRRLVPALRAAAVALALALSVACNAGGHGSLCSNDSTCGAGGRCLPTQTPGRSLCMAPCTEGTRLCADGAVCMLTAGAYACYLGGIRALGDPCTSDAECEAGTVCPPSIGACQQACTVGDDRPCYTGEVCEGPSALEGFCRPAPADAGLGAGTDAGP